MALGDLEGQDDALSALQLALGLEILRLSRLIILRP